MKSLSVILILGLGTSGRAAAHWFAKNNRSIRLVDENDDQHINISTIKQELAKFSNIEYVLNYQDNNSQLSLLDNVSQIIISPGISILNSIFSNLLNIAIKKNIEIISEIEVFARILDDLKNKQNYHPKIIAITGTNGKTTVTALTSFLINSYGLYAVAVGNIGISALSMLDKSINLNHLPDVWVIELSSFQLSTTYNLHPNVATILNITQDHIDWHINMDNYVKSKFNILKNADTVIINRDDIYIMNHIQQIKYQNIYSFGVSSPKFIGDMGIIKINQDDNKIWLVSYNYSNKNIDLKNIDNNIMYVTENSKLSINGIHNYLNILAALLLIRSIGIPIIKVSPFLSKYLGEPHRNTLVCTINGVEYINDSKATNIGATIAALKSYNQEKIIILGGISKGQDFSLLLPYLKTNIRSIILIGVDKYQISNILDMDNIKYSYADSMEDAIKQAHKYSQKGDIVILSPACSSFDMFSSYKHRGKIFIKEVLKLAQNYK